MEKHWTWRERRAFCTWVTIATAAAAYLLAGLIQ